MQYNSATDPADSYPVVQAAQLPVLLVFFMPPTLYNRQEQASLTMLITSLRSQLNGLVRVLRIDKAIHADVLQSFAITKTPAFVLVRRGVELLRQEGVCDEAALVGLVKDRLR